MSSIFMFLFNIQSASGFAIFTQIMFFFHAVFTPSELNSSFAPVSIRLLWKAISCQLSLD